MFIANDLHPTADNLLLGITDSAVEGDWKLFDGNPTTYMGPWNGNEPNGGASENYVQMFTMKRANGGGGNWNDVPGTYERWSYCTFEPFQVRYPQIQNTLRNHCELIGPQTEPYLDLKNKFEQKYCFTLKTEYASEGDITNDINFIYNDVHIHTFTTGVDDPPLCLPLNKMDMENDIFKMQSTGDTCIFELTIGDSKVSVNGKNQFWFGRDSELSCHIDSGNPICNLEIPEVCAILYDGTNQSGQRRDSDLIKHRTVLEFLRGRLRNTPPRLWMPPTLSENLIVEVLGF